ncbi:major facilitator superfamily domain-containing protein [Podospora didyma]|uniref:Major facilitator superfamily domain-containing protein n=1 Tax=Podospora didyma TaxID=330526 RepID=A0AAE0NHH6_9PEZI|nr:major facilitator superfamily domain-containing protein [Podospora didyma]
MPLVFSLYLVAFLDRSNIGNAKTAGMSADLGINDMQFQWLLLIFYIPYILFSPLVMALYSYRANIWTFGAVFLLGLFSLLQAPVKTFGGLMVLRFLIGFSEVAFAPGMPYYLSFFYRRTEIGSRCGVYLSAAPLASMISGLLAYGVSSRPHSIAGWRIFFTIEGILTIVLSIVAFVYLPNSPADTRTLRGAEIQVARDRIIMQSGSTARRDRFKSPRLNEIVEGLADLQTWIQSAMFFCCNVSFSSLPVFLPSILHSMGKTSVQAQGYTAGPYFAAFVVCWVSTILADKYQQRGITIGVLSSIGCSGYLILAKVHDSFAVQYFAVFLVAAGVFPAIANILPWSLNNQGTDTKRGLGIALLVMFGQCGPVIGLLQFNDEPYYTKSMFMCAGFMAVNALLAGILRWRYVRKNKRLGTIFQGQNQQVREAVGRVLGFKVSANDAVEALGGNDVPPPHSHPNDMQGARGYRYVL